MPNQGLGKPFARSPVGYGRQSGGVIAPTIHFQPALCSFGSAIGLVFLGHLFPPPAPNAPVRAVLMVVETPSEVLHRRLVVEILSELH